MNEVIDVLGADDLERKPLELFDVVIIGAGASGLMSACLLACSELSVLILEKEDRIGRKLSATGNGRCNLTNLTMDWKCYYGNREWISTVLKAVPPNLVIDRFASLGVLTREKDGYVYPHSNQAATVIGALYRGIRHPNIRLELSNRVIDIEHESTRFYVETETGRYGSENLIMACGGPAGAEQGGTDDGYAFLKKTGHTITDIVPGLTGLHAAGRWWKEVAGTRIQGTFTLFVDGIREGRETGEIQITKTGVSGIPVFQLCRLAAVGLKAGKPVWGEIDFVPSLSVEDCERWVALNGIEGLVPTKWIPLIGKNNPTLKTLVKTLKHFEFTITDTYGIDKAQVSAGGVPVEEIDPNTFESRVCPGLYVLGELIDMDGMCGGYNLHLAWAGAILSAKHLLAFR